MFLCSFVVNEYLFILLNKHVERHSVVMEHLSLRLRGVTLLAASSTKNSEIAESTKNGLKASSPRKTCGKRCRMIVSSDHWILDEIKVQKSRIQTSV